MIPTMILFGVVFGRWWLITLVAAALGWPLLLLATDVIGVDAGLVGAAALAVANAAVGVFVHQCLLHAYRHFHRRVSPQAHD